MLMCAIYPLGVQSYMTHKLHKRPSQCSVVQSPMVQRYVVDGAEGVYRYKPYADADMSKGKTSKRAPERVTIH